MDTELKFRVGDPEEMLQRIDGLTETVYTGSIIETDRYFDDFLFPEHETLRIRVLSDGQGVVIYEGELNLTTGVNDAKVMELLFGLLECPFELEIKKNRQEWKLPTTDGEVTLHLDRLDFGCFVKLRGDEEAVRVVRGMLGLTSSKIEEKSYLDLAKEAAAQA